MSSAIKDFIEQKTLKNIKQISIKKPHTISEIRKINERKLNSVLGNISSDELANIIRKPLPKPSKVRIPIKKGNPIPKILSSIILSLRLLDEPVIENRIKIFIGYCKYKNYSFNTATRYFNILKRNNIFGQYILEGENDDDDDNSGNGLPSHLKPNKIAFIDNGQLHVRIVSMADFKTFAVYLNENLSQYSSPIAIAMYTGLRTSEILQFTTYTLYQLYEKQQPISIKRKQTIVTTLNPEPIYWEPVYNTHLNMFVQTLIDSIFKDEYESFLQTKINIKLFQITPKTLGNRIKSLYFNAVGKKAPHGFGIHSCRNMIAMLMAEKTENILAIQTFLQHKNVKTTRQYIKADYTYTTKEFNRLTKYEFQDVYTKLNEKQNP